MQLQAIRPEARTKIDTVLTEQQRQQLQQISPSNGQRKGPGFARISGLTDAQKTQLRQTHSASRQQMDTILRPEQN